MYKKIIIKIIDFSSNSQMKAPGLTTMIDGKNKTLYMQVIYNYMKEIDLLDLSVYLRC